MENALDNLKHTLAVQKDTKRPKKGKKLKKMPASIPSDVLLEAGEQVWKKMRKGRRRRRRSEDGNQ